MLCVKMDEIVILFIMYIVGIVFYNYYFLVIISKYVYCMF